MSDAVVRPIETRYAGHRFRSRLEARWAVFFDAMGIPWQYEVEGFTLSDRRKYLPDFLLPECGTWVEVKGSADHLSVSLIERATRDLPWIEPKQEAGPTLMILGPIPEPLAGEQGDYGWCGLDPEPFDPDAVLSRPYGFGAYHKNKRPWLLCNADDTWGDPAGCLVPSVDPYECFGEYGGAERAYAAARAARFEHGEAGNGPDDQTVAKAVARGVEVAMQELKTKR